MILYLVRHAEYASDVIGHENYDANAAAHITRLGRIEAVALAARLRTYRVDRIFHSPFQRARETAEIVCASTNVPCVMREDLHEHRIVLENHDRKAWKAFRDAMRNDHTLTNAMSESFDQAAQRFIHSLDEIRASGVERPCVIAHALMMQAALTTLFGFASVPHLDTASITTIEWKDGKYLLCQLNERPWSFPLLLAKAARRFKIPV